jgi:hypothetical protein
MAASAAASDADSPRLPAQGAVPTEADTAMVPAAPGRVTGTASAAARPSVSAAVTGLQVMMANSSPPSRPQAAPPHRAPQAPMRAAVTART